LIGALVLAAAIVRADDVLHEYVPDIQPDEALRALAEREGDAAAIVYNGEVLPEPEPEAADRAPPMVATPGDGALAEQPGQRSPTFRPDRQTQLEGSLEYFDVFSPSIAPFKRVTSLDATLLGDDGLTPVLGIYDTKRRAVKVENAAAPAPDARPRDRFWGQVKLDFSRGRVVPLPSVSPESRILSLRTEPALELAIERDGADNFFAVAKAAPAAAQVTVTFLTDAPRAYFGTALPHVPVASLEKELRPIPDSVRERGRAFAKQLGITRASDLAQALSLLTAHFRAFEESAEPPPDSGDIYLDLARAQKGICRHRAYAFVVTAQALGIPARFVQNEAHSWVEVKLARSGWMRIDLGGAAHGLTAHGANDRPLYQASEPDPLPRPPVYEASYSLLGRDVQGVRRPGDKELAGRWVAPAEPGTQGGSAQASDHAAFMSSPNPHAPRDRSQRQPLRVVIDQRHESVLRGQELRVSGVVRDQAGLGVKGMRIEVSLASATRRERMLLGVTVSLEHGAFASAFGIPPDLAVGDYRLVVVTPGDTTYLPAIAE
jgi:transglutaminase-like putative cysteine protease